MDFIMVSLCLAIFVLLSSPEPVLVLCCGLTTINAEFSTAKPIGATYFFLSKPAHSHAGGGVMMTLSLVLFGCSQTAGTRILWSEKELSETKQLGVGIRFIHKHSTQKWPS